MTNVAGLLLLMSSSVSVAGAGGIYACSDNSFDVTKFDLKTCKVPDFKKALSTVSKQMNVSTKSVVDALGDDTPIDWGSEADDTPIDWGSEADDTPIESESKADTTSKKTQAEIKLEEELAVKKAERERLLKMPPDNIDRKSGTVPGVEITDDPTWVGLSAHDCWELVKDQDEYGSIVGWGYRNGNHPDPKLKNSCFVYSRNEDGTGMPPFEGNPNDTITISGCHKPGLKLSEGCITSEEREYNAYIKRMPPDGIDIVNGMPANVKIEEDPSWIGMSAEDCFKLAEDSGGLEAGIRAWGYRTGDYKDPKLRNSCFLYRDGDFTEFNGTNDATIFTGCVGPDMKVSKACLTKDELMVEIQNNSKLSQALAAAKMATKMAEQLATMAAEQVAKAAKVAAEALKKAAQETARAVSKAVQEAGKRVAEAAKKAIQAAKKAIETAKKAAEYAARKTVEAAKAVARTTKEAARKAVQAARQAAEALKKAAEAAVRKAKEAAEATKRAAEAAARRAKEAAEAAARKAKQAAEAAARKAREAAEATARALAEAKRRAEQAARAAAEATRRAAEEVARKAKAAAEAAKQAALEAAKKAAREVKRKAEEAARVAAEAKRKAEQAAKAAIEAAKKAAQEAKRKAEEAAKAAAAAAKKAAEEVARKAEQAAAAARRAAAEAARKAREVAEAARRAAEEVARKAREAAKKAAEEVARKAREAAEAAKRRAEQAARAAAAAAKKAAEEVKRKAEQAAKAAADAAKNAAKAVAKAGKSIGKAIGLCFSPDTPVRLESGELVLMKDLKLGDVLMGGIIVDAILRIKNRTKDVYYKIHSKELNAFIYVTGMHYIKNGDTFVHVCELPDAIPTNEYGEELSCLVTSTHEIPVGEHIFWDWEDNLVPQTK